MNFIGLANFKDLLTDDLFYKAMFNTFYLMLGIPIGLLLALLLAMGLNRKIPGTTTFRVIYYIPVISSLAAVSIMWNWAYNGDYGLVNQFLDLFGIEGPNWLANKDTVKPALIIMTVWKGLGYTMLLYLAALQSVSRTYYEAAELDGANGFQIFRNIQIFTEMNIMTPTGGPEYASASIVFYIWQKAFSNLQMGYASAMAMILGIFIFVITLVQFKLNERSAYDGD